MGMVYLATHERLPGLFVVKTVHPALASADEGAARLRQEGEVLAGLNHPNIVRVFDVNEAPGGAPYLVLEFLDGLDLNDILNGRGLHPWQVVTIVRQVASALGAAHACNVIHRDLKPENILIVPVFGQDDAIKLIDFGASKVGMSGKVLTRTGLIGTPNYMSPEQVRGTREQVDARSDQFALAVMTYEMLARERPFSDNDPLVVLGQILDRPTPRLALKVDWNPAAVDQVLGRGMAKDPSERYATVLEFSQALEDAVGADIGGAPRPLRLFASETQPVPLAEDAAPRVPSEVTAVSGDRIVLQAWSGVADVPAANDDSVIPIQPKRRRRWSGGLLVLMVAATAGVLLFHPRAWPAITAWQHEAKGRVQHFLRPDQRRMP